MRQLVCGIIALSCMSTGTIANLSILADLQDRGAISIDVRKLAADIAHSSGKRRVGTQIRVSGTCSTPDSEIIVPASILWNDPKLDRRELTLRVLTGALKEDSGVSVTQSAPNTFMISQQVAGHSIFDTKVHRMAFSKHDKASATDVLSALLSSQQVAFTSKRLGMRRINYFTALGSTFSPVDNVHWLGSQTTFGDALNAILSRFGGVLLYEECKAPDGEIRFDLSYYGQ